MGAAEITLIVGLALVLFLSRQLPRIAEALRNRPEQERRAFRVALFVLAIASTAALLLALKHSFLGR